MYSIKAERKGRAGIFITIALFSAGFIVFALGIIIREYNSVLQFTSLVPFTACVLFGARYVFTSYEYTVDRGLFTVKEKRGRRVRTVARIGLEDIHNTIEINTGRIPKNQVRRKLYDYRPDIRPKNFALITITKESYLDGHDELVIAVCPDEKMLRMLRGDLL